MDIAAIWTKLKGWLVIGIPAAVGLAIAVVMRKSPVSNPKDDPIAKGPDMAPADKAAATLEKEQVVLAEQHATITEVLKPKPQQPDLSLEDAVAQYNKDK